LQKSGLKRNIFSEFGELLLGLRPKATKIFKIYVNCGILSQKLAFIYALFSKKNHHILNDSGNEKSKVKFPAFFPKYRIYVRRSEYINQGVTKRDVVYLC
jgi:hypothetical protein